MNPETGVADLDSFFEWLKRSTLLKIKMETFFTLLNLQLMMFKLTIYVPSFKSYTFVFCPKHSEHLRIQVQATFRLRFHDIQKEDVCDFQ